MIFEESTIMALKQAAEKKQHFLVLTGSSVSNTIRKSGLDKNLFNLRHLNYLSITRTCLRTVPEEIGNLTNLTTLLLRLNQITALPSSIDKLINLKEFDCSTNKLTSCPQELSNLPQLKILNLASNLLESIPSQRANVALRILNLGNNKLKTFPDVCYTELVYLSELYLKNNEIKDIPTTISQLPSLNILDLQGNLLIDLPAELADCKKLEKLNIRFNRMYNKHLMDLSVFVKNTEKIISYLKSNFPRNTEIADKLKDRKKDNNTFSSINNLNVVSRCGVIRRRGIIRNKTITDDATVIKVTEYVDSVRPYIVACIVKDINFTEENFKKFIQLQKKLHDGLCENKNAATIMTHDMKFITPGNLTYTAKPPMELEIKPAPRNRIYTGEVLFKQLQAEAENVCKITKQNIYPERYNYVNLLKGKSLFPCLLDHSQQVISFPPIINSNVTKVSPSTQTMFVEVTSATSYAICRKVLDKFLKEMLIILNPMKIVKNYHYILDVEQVKVEDTDGNIKIIYPLKADFDTSVTKVLLQRA